MSSPTPRLTAMQNAGDCSEDPSALNQHLWMFKKGSHWTGEDQSHSGYFDIFYCQNCLTHISIWSDSL